MPQISIIIRTKNEARWLPSCLEALGGQTVKDFEVIAVDSGSKDQTLEIFRLWQKRLTIKIVTIPPESFTYPYACNVGMRHVNSPIAGFLSGHSVPVRKDYLEQGLKHFANDRVAGVYGPVVPLPIASLVEKLFYTNGLGSSLAMKLIDQRTARPVTELRLGILGNTNSFIRRDLWQKWPFDERLNQGGEDTGWAGYWLKRGYRIIWEPGTVIRHSHGIGLRKLIKQYRHWQRVYRHALEILNES